MKKYEFKFIYPAARWEQPEHPLMVRLPSDHVKKSKLNGGLYIPDGAVGHILMRVGTRSTKGEMEWTPFTTLCEAKEPSPCVTRPLPAQGRETCPACLALYKADHDLPEMRALANWETGGFKQFGGVL